MRIIEVMLFEVFKAQGATDAAGLAKKAADEFDRDQRDRRIYELRARMSVEELGLRFSLSVPRINQVVRRQYKLKKVG